MERFRRECNPLSRFVEEIPKHLIVEDAPTYADYACTPRQRTYFSTASESVPRKDFFGEKPKARPAANLSLQAGDRVRHLSFGDGEILSARPMGGDVLYEVIFDRVGTKKLMGTYAKLKKID